MSKHGLVLAALELVALRVPADRIVSEYEFPAPDSAAANREYGLKTFSNAASVTSLAVGEGRIRFAAAMASDSIDPWRNGYTAVAGFRHPLSLDLAEMDLTGLSALSFEYKNSIPITDALEISFGSGSYADSSVRSGRVYKAELKGASVWEAHTNWEKVSIDALDFALPDWWTPPADFPSFRQVLKRATSIQFRPRSLYTSEGMDRGSACKKCVGPDMGPLALEIRKITLKGVEAEPWPNPTDLGCEATARVCLLDDFQDGDAESRVGGNWWALADSGGATPIPDRHQGSSTAKVGYFPGNGGAFGYALVDASLNKRKGGIWHQDAGWAGIATTFEGEGMLAGMEKLTGISFLIKGLDTSSHARNIDFRVSTSWGPDSEAHFVAIPIGPTLGEEGKRACVRPEDLQQSPRLSESSRRDFFPADTRKLAWISRINDRLHPSIDTAKVSFMLTDVRLYGQDCYSGVKKGQTVRQALSVHADLGALKLSGYQGVQKFDVLTLGGKRIASFVPAPTVALFLPTGAYLLVGHQASQRLVHSFVVSH